MPLSSLRGVEDSTEVDETQKQILHSARPNE
jgi:hypothetical protein